MKTIKSFLWFKLETGGIYYRILLFMLCQQHYFFSLYGSRHQLVHLHFQHTMDCFKSDLFITSNNL